MFALDTTSFRSVRIQTRILKFCPRDIIGIVKNRSVKSNFQQRKKLASKGIICCSTTDDEASKSQKASSQVMEGNQQARLNLEWSVSADGNVRVLVLSIEDHVDFLDGRKMKSIQDSPRWLDNFIVPGQYIGVRRIKSSSSDSSDDEDDEKGAEILLPIVSSPNEARMKSALLDATILEIIVERLTDLDDLNSKLSHMGPGDILKVSQTLGRGFASLFSTYVGLQSALEEKRCLLMVCNGASGLGSMRAALSWPPVMALATTQSVSCVFVAQNLSSAAYVQDWDEWRQNGITVVPVYQEEDKEIEEILERALFAQPETFTNLVKYPMEGAVLMSGFSGSTSTYLTKRLAEHGLPVQQLLQMVQNLFGIM